jgi:hypothetical protein
MLNLALSIRQPWAWAILNAGKDIENRSWRTQFRGLFYIHAAAGMTRDEYEAYLDFTRDRYRFAFPQALRAPRPEQLARGGIIGSAELVDCVADHPSPWFVGPFGFVLRNARPLPFRPLKGALGFFVIPGRCK